MPTKVVEKLIGNYASPHSAVGPTQLQVLLTNLEQVLQRGLPGAVVEMGCATGLTSMLFRRMLDLYEPQKPFHVYDSFEGLPEKVEQDQNPEFDYSERFQEGMLSWQIADVVRNFQDAGLKLPEIHKGWFADIPDEQYPDEVAFAFFDGDFYTSIYDSLVKIFPRLVPEARVHIHDYGWAALPGVKQACDDFLQHKLEVVLECVAQQGVLIKL